MEAPARSHGVVGTYGRAAVHAARFLGRKKGLTPLDAWKSAVLKEFPHSQSLQDKSCPRTAFLGLCQEGHLDGVAKGKYTRSVKNRQYAVNAARLLDTDSSITTSELWLQATKGHKVSHNSQMDVVISLWNEGFLSSP